MSEDATTYGTNPTQMQDIAHQIKVALETETDSSNPHEMIEKIKELSVLTANAASLQANAKKRLLQKELQLLEKYRFSKLPPSVLMRAINAECFEESGFLCYAERLGAGLSHSLDALRSSLSYIKCELENIRHQA